MAKISLSSMPTTTGSHWASLQRAVNGNPLEEMGKYLPEDLEMQDIGPLAALIDQYMNEQYGEFEPEIVHTPEKDYYLPALKVLLRDADGVLASPGYRAVWEGGELAAECHDYKRQVYKRTYRALYMQFMNGSTLSFGEDDIKDVEIEEKPHTSPHEGCDCGIYGTVNLDEIADYLSKFEYRLPGTQKRPEQASRLVFNISISPSTAAYNSETVEAILCLIEPSPGTDVVLSRKGWKAGHAFISEIIGETISLEDASALLSIAWKRNIDIRRLFNEDR